MQNKFNNRFFATNPHIEISWQELVRILEWAIEIKHFCTSRCRNV